MRKKFKSEQTFKLFASFPKSSLVKFTNGAFRREKSVRLKLNSNKVIIYPLVLVFRLAKFV